MTMDLLTNIQRELDERLSGLRGAVEEHDRLQAELNALDTPAGAAPEALANPGPAARPEPRVEPAADPEPPEALDAEPAAPDIAVEPPTTAPAPVKPQAVQEPAAVQKQQAVQEPAAVQKPAANVVRLPVRPVLPRARMVSPKIARLMRAPRRPALERAGVVRVGAGTSPAEPFEQIDADAESRISSQAMSSVP